MSIMAASKKPTNTWTATDLNLSSDELGHNGAMIEILRTSILVGERKRVMLEGDIKETASKLANALLQEGALKAS